jgi:BirA family biotin operon repressor/biotin-[acetyl-CoA-carboxylase] ligase
VDAGDDLTTEALEPMLGERALQCHPVLLSIASHASDWAAAGAPDGAVVVAGSQVAARGRAGTRWSMQPGRGLTFALVLRPKMAAAKEGFLYTLVLAALADVLGPGVKIEWPDEVYRGDTMVAATGIEVRLGAEGVKSAAINVLLPEAEPPRGELLARVVHAIEARVDGSHDQALEDHRRLCATIGRTVRGQLLGGQARFEGTAIDTLEDGALVIAAGGGRRLPVRPQDVGVLRKT